MFVPDPQARPAGNHPWGAPVANPASKKRSWILLSAVGDGSADAGRFFSPLVVGPALWKILGALDAGLASTGKPSFVRLPHPRADSEKLDMRTFFEDDMAPLLRSAAFRKIGRAFASARSVRLTTVSASCSTPSSRSSWPVVR